MYTQREATREEALETEDVGTEVECQEVHNRSQSIRAKERAPVPQKPENKEEGSKEFTFFYLLNIKESETK